MFAALPQAMPHRRWAMAARGFLCQNVAIGAAFGAFGVTVLPLQAAYGIGRAEAMLGLSMAVLAMGLFSPVAGALIARRGLKPAMLLGVSLSAAGYAGLSLAPGLPVVVALYAPIGAGLALCGSMPASILANNWFQPRPGRAIGFVNMPLLVAVLPVLGQVVIDRAGLGALYLALAALHLLLLPAIWGIVDRPEQSIGAPRQDPSNAPAVTVRSLLAHPSFWALVLGAGILSAFGIAGVSHLVPLTREMGASAAAASLMAGLSGGASMAGSLVAGLVCDRLGAARTLALVGVALALSWMALGEMSWGFGIALPVLVVGLCGASVFPAVNVLASHLYGPAALPQVLGLYGLLMLPLTFCLPPLAGEIHDRAGGYGAVTLAISAASFAVAVLFEGMARSVSRRKRTDAALV